MKFPSGTFKMIANMTATLTTLPALRHVEKVQTGASFCKSAIALICLRFLKGAFKNNLVCTHLFVCLIWSSGPHEGCTVFFESQQPPCDVSYHQYASSLA